jgi:hypothetical protein
MGVEAIIVQTAGKVEAVAVIIIKVPMVKLKNKFLNVFTNCIFV